MCIVWRGESKHTRFVSNGTYNHVLVADAIFGWCCLRTATSESGVHPSEWEFRTMHPFWRVFQDSGADDPKCTIFVGNATDKGSVACLQ